MPIKTEIWRIDNVAFSSLEADRKVDAGAGKEFSALMRSMGS